MKAITPAPPVGDSPRQSVLPGKKAYIPPYTPKSNNRPATATNSRQR